MTADRQPSRGGAPVLDDREGRDPGRWRVAQQGEQAPVDIDEVATRADPPDEDRRPFLEAHQEAAREADGDVGAPDGRQVEETTLQRGGAQAEQVLAPDVVEAAIDGRDVGVRRPLQTHVLELERGRVGHAVHGRRREQHGEEGPGPDW
jgi:hypothetical protein